MNPTNTRIAAAVKAMAAYETEGATIRAEIADVERMRQRIERNPCVRLMLGRSTDRSFNADYYDREPAEYPASIKPIVLTSPGTEAPTVVWSADQRNRLTPAVGMDRASEIVYPGLKACLLMWLAERESKARKALAAWESRDPIAEAVAAANPNPSEPA